MRSIPGVLHDPGSGTARRVVLDRDGDTLRVSGDGAERAVPLLAVALAPGGWSGDAAHLVWKEGDEDWAVTVSGADAVGDLEGVLPAELAAEVRTLRLRGVRSRRRGRRTLAILTALLLLPVVLVVCAWVFRDRIVDVILRRLPVTVDAQIGEIALQQVRVSHRLQQGGPAVDSVRAIGERLVAAAGPAAQGHRFRFEVAEDATPNAFAAPGGLIVVHTGLLTAARGPDEVAGVLAHEVMHVTLRHSMRQLVLRAGVGAGVQLLVGSPEGAAGVLTAAASNLATLGFSREQEREADSSGLDLLERAALPPDGLVEFFGRLATESGAPPALLSTHPAPNDRSSRLRAEIARRGAWPVRPLAVDWPAVQAAAGGR